MSYFPLDNKVEDMIRALVSFIHSFIHCADMAECLLLTSGTVLSAENMGMNTIDSCCDGGSYVPVRGERNDADKRACGCIVPREDSGREGPASQGVLV